MSYFRVAHAVSLTMDDRSFVRQIQVSPGTVQRGRAHNESMKQCLCGSMKFD